MRTYRSRRIAGVLAMVIVGLSSFVSAEASINCGEFRYLYDAQRVLDGIAGDPYGLDRSSGVVREPEDYDGIACNHSMGISFDYVQYLPLGESPTTGNSSPTMELRDGLQKVEIASVLGYGWISVKVNERFWFDEEFDVSLIGITTPSRSGSYECYDRESLHGLEQLLTKGTVVYLEEDVVDIPNDDDFFKQHERWMWMATENGFELVNSLLVLNGDAVAAIEPPNEKYAGDVREAQTKAARSQNGLWAECQDAQ